MEYQIKELAELAGVSTRTLRYYDSIGLLKPKRMTEAGYRMYGEYEVNLLQQILFYRSLDFKLEEINEILSDPQFDLATALEEHHERLQQKVIQLQGLIDTVEKTIANYKGERKMSDKEKFAAFKQQKLQENETKYGEEIRQKYGEKTVKEANKQFLNLTEEEYDTMQETEAKLFVALEKVMESKDMESDTAKSVYELHKKWLSYSWPKYDKDAHKSLAMMYVADERFKEYYDSRVAEGATEMLCEIIQKFA